MAETESNQDHRQTSPALLSLVQALVGELHPGRPAAGVSLDSSLDKDLGLDSLGRVELLRRVERHFDAVLPERLFAEAETPRDLLRALRQASPESGRAETLAFENLVLGAGEAAPSSAATLVEALDWQIRQHPDRPHIRFYSDEAEGDTLT